MSKCTRDRVKLSMLLVALAKNFVCQRGLTYSGLETRMVGVSFVLLRSVPHA
jgi:hypothetical protein